jgi:hypothetical protein
MAFGSWGRPKRHTGGLVFSRALTAYQATPCGNTRATPGSGCRRPPEIQPAGTNAWFLGLTGPAGHRSGHCPDESVNRSVLLAAVLGAPLSGVQDRPGTPGPRRDADDQHAGPLPGPLGLEFDQAAVRNASSRRPPGCVLGFM